MKKFKKLSVMLLILSLTITLIAIPASAVTYYDQAVSLDALGLLRGTGYGYELYRTATRAEAAAMLVRLLGKEKEAFAGKYQYPFKDVPLWADKYVGYLYVKGLTKGTSETSFSPDLKCDTKMFTVFLLRSLGFTEAGGDFTYDTALRYAQGMGLMDSQMASQSDFLRGDMAALSYSVLFKSTKADEDHTLLDKLLNENAVDVYTANQLRDSFVLYKEYVSAIAASLPDGSAQLLQNTRIEFYAHGQSAGQTTKSLVTIDETGGRTVIKSEDETTYSGYVEYYSTYWGGQVVKASSFNADGWTYTEANGQKIKYREASSIPEAFIPDSGVVPFYLINRIEKSEDAGDTSYDIYYNPDLHEDYAADVFKQTLRDGYAIIDIPRCASALNTTFDAAGRLISQELRVSLGVNVKNDERMLPMNTELQMRMTIVDTGSHITVTLPADLGSYQELD